MSFDLLVPFNSFSVLFSTLPPVITHSLHSLSSSFSSSCIWWPLLPSDHLSKWELVAEIWKQQPRHKAEGCDCCLQIRDKLPVIFRVPSHHTPRLPYIRQEAGEGCYVSGILAYHILPRFNYRHLMGFFLLPKVLYSCSRCDFTGTLWTYTLLYKLEHVQAVQL